ncbi:Cytochrome P450 [Dillenia turbinata]|uniref:Cytochrome P450 n=1 Tax=Dillenia turbinata TaxID=194707 RepID=A0AAN8Z4S0_9MAGN
MWDMFAAGTDTTYTVLEWAMTEILRHQEIMKKLQIETLKFHNTSYRAEDQTYSSRSATEKHYVTDGLLRDLIHR